MKQKYCSNQNIVETLRQKKTILAFFNVIFFVFIQACVSHFTFQKIRIKAGQRENTHKHTHMPNNTNITQIYIKQNVNRPVKSRQSRRLMVTRQNQSPWITGSLHYYTYYSVVLLHMSVQGDPGTIRRFAATAMNQPSVWYWTWAFLGSLWDAVYLKEVNCKKMSPFLWIVTVVHASCIAFKCSLWNLTVSYFVFYYNIFPKKLKAFKFKKLN